MTDTPKLSHNETIKTKSRLLRGTLREGLEEVASGAISEDDQQLIKFHGIYLQDDRDLRPERAKRKLDKAYAFMARLRVPGGVLSREQYLAAAGAYLNGIERRIEAGLNPAEWYITKTTSHVRYGEDGEPSVAQYWLRASKLPAGSVSPEDMDAILAQYIYAVPQWETQLAPDRILMVPSGDLQLGKPEGGGTEATIERFARYTNEIAADLAASGGVELLILPWLGATVPGTRSPTASIALMGARGRIARPSRSNSR